MEPIEKDSAPKPEVQGPSVFKLVAPNFPGGRDGRFKPAGMNEVGLNIPPEPGPKPEANEGKPVTGLKPPPPDPVPMAAMMPEDDQKVMARMESLLKIDLRVKELEEENRNLVKMVARLQAENAALKAK